jgi:hypothetical protein
MAKNSKRAEMTSDELEQILFDAMRVHGVLPPTIGEVAALDAELSDLELPFEPSDPDELLKELDVDIEEDAVILPFSSLEDSSIRNLARAGRQGGELTDEIEQRMVDDKTKFLQNEHDE